MGVTAVKRVENRGVATVALFDVENPGAPGHAVAVAPGAGLDVDMWVPWAGAGDFAQKHLRLDVGGQPRFWIWQALNADGDHVRFSTDGRWRDRGERVDGISAVDGVRTLVVYDGGFQLVDLPEEVFAAVSARFGTRRFRREPDDGDQGAVPSIPKLSAVAFSVAGPASDARSCVYRDSGKRYALAIEDGVVWVTHPDGRRTALRDAVSYSNRRVGERHQAPPFDLLAASGGRILAKARDADRFYFTMLDEMFMHCTPRGVMSVPSTYFKLDPEHGQTGARPADLARPVEGSFTNHPAAERFPLFRMLLTASLVDMMVVRMERGVWHLVDPRPSLGTVNLQLAALQIGIDWFDRLLALSLPPGLLRPWAEGVKADLQRRRAAAQAPDPSPPEGVPTYDHVVYGDDAGEKITLRSIAFRRVLDIGIGHVHHHEQYQHVTGGELQPVLASWRYATGYRLANGPVFDGDGYIDGTCNMYALVELAVPAGRPPAYALLYQDEHSYFTQRWRQVDPRDSRGLSLALVTDLADPMYGFDDARYWCPFRAGQIGAESRLAVAAQVLLVTGDAGRPDTGARIFSINFSWSTMDHSWRWRLLPPGAEVRYFDAAATAAGTEPVATTTPADAVYPQTVRLREDMTVHLKGTRERLDGTGAEAGRWYQRYLPASHRLRPAASELLPGERPRSGYDHPWRFMPEETYQLADRFSHFGVYATVDSRAQYYEVEPAGDADAQALAAAGGGPWTDVEFQLYRWAPKLSWSAPLHLLTPSNLVPGVLDRRPPSLFNPETRLRIVRRGERWIATHADKRDEDLLPFGGPYAGHEEFDPVTLTVGSGSQRAYVTLRRHVWRTAPPAVEIAEFRWSGNTGEPASVVLHTPPEQPSLPDLWRIRIAALVPGSPGAVVQLLNATTPGRLTAAGARAWEYRWTPAAAEATSLRSHCTTEGAERLGTSLWLEDIVGHVSVPEQTRWLRTRPKVLVVDRTIAVPERSANVDTGIDLQPGDDIALDATGTIWAGVPLTGRNGPEGWSNVDHDPKFPLHTGPDARPFALIARFGTLPWFYVGTSRPRAGFADRQARRLHLRTNDDAPGNGDGQFSCRIRAWRAPPAMADVRIVAVLANPAGSDVTSEAGEHVTLRNLGDVAASIGGWYLEDAAGHRLRLPAGRVLGPGQTVHVHTGPGTTTRDRVFCGRRAAVLNNGGDLIVLHRDDGRALSAFRY